MERQEPRQGNDAETGARGARHTRHPACRPDRARWNGIDTLVDISGVDALDAASPIQLLEESEYLYAVVDDDRNW